MSARDELFDHVMSLNASICGERCVGCMCRESDGEEANKLIDDFAHELAEKQRAELDDMNDGPVYVDDREWIQRASKLPDLIDPEVSS
ncbi:hypothetical protein M2271_003560 [Streptomyces sp. LBL]|uniref:hypothetical protein n=1 Tax=Streptomyces sp. LBL TaxID=2940562 RepID=UPI0024730E83|nr:hypothetical protein [Streptomyces sp. LBL]MDH6625749.1 hypothetical protein [Streptomyces sp. LBL]